MDYNAKSFADKKRPPYMDHDMGYDRSYTKPGLRLAQVLTHTKKSLCVQHDMGGHKPNTKQDLLLAKVGQTRVNKKEHVDHGNDQIGVIDTKIVQLK